VKNPFNAVIPRFNAVIPKALLVIGLGLVAMPPRAAAAVTDADCTKNFCVFECPPHPDTFCESWNCTGGSCSAVECGGQEYAVDCDVVVPT